MELMAAQAAHTAKIDPTERQRPNQELRALCEGQVLRLASGKKVAASAMVFSARRRLHPSDLSLEMVGDAAIVAACRAG